MIYMQYPNIVKSRLTQLVSFDLAQQQRNTNLFPVTRFAWFGLSTWLEWGQLTERENIIPTDWVDEGEIKGEGVFAMPMWPTKGTKWYMEQELHANWEGKLISRRPFIQ